MCGSPSVGSQLWRGFLFSPVAAFSSSPSQLLGVPCTGTSPPCGTLPKTSFWIQPKRWHFQRKMIHTLGCRSSSLVFVDLESNQAHCLSVFLAQMHNNNSGYDNSGYDDDDNDDDDSEEVQISDILCTAKSARTCRTWKGRYLYY